MKTIIFASTCLLLASCGIAPRQGSSLESFSSKLSKVKVELLCQQDDGDQWYEIGIESTKKAESNAYVIYHNSDDESAKLIKKTKVRKSIENDLRVFTDDMDTIKLTVSRAQHKQGNLVTLSDGPGGLNLKGLECYENQTIEFTRK